MPPALVRRVTSPIRQTESKSQAEKVPGAEKPDSARLVPCTVGQVLTEKLAAVGTV